MGKQFRFIMDENDEKDFFEYVRHTGRIFENQKHLGATEKFDIPEYTWMNLYLFKGECGSLIFREITDEIKYVDTTASPVIEFGETLLRENVKEIQRGRLYISMKYYNEKGDLEQKSELLDMWYKELIRWLKNRLECVKICSNGRLTKEYVSKSMVKFLKEGFHLLG